MNPDVTMKNRTQKEGGEALTPLPPLFAEYSQAYPFYFHRELLLRPLGLLVFLSWRSGVLMVRIPITMARLPLVIVIVVIVVIVVVIVVIIVVVIVIIVIVVIVIIVIVIIIIVVIIIIIVVIVIACWQEGLFFYLPNSFADPRIEQKLEIILRHILGADKVPIAGVLFFEITNRCPQGKCQVARGHQSRHDDEKQHRVKEYFSQFHCTSPLPFLNSQ
jgi:ABC-type multidrug transport system fused ATPase/permease subunit